MKEGESETRSGSRACRCNGNDSIVDSVVVIDW